MSIQKEIRTGLKNLLLHDWAYKRGSHVSFYLNDSDVGIILKYLDSKDGLVKTKYQ